MSPIHSRSRRALIGALGLAMFCGALTGCATASPVLPAESAAPRVLDNCGTELRLTDPPQRVVTIKSTSTEMLLALGLSSRVIGTAFQDGPVPKQWASQAESIPELAEKVPSQEVVLEAAPDFVYAGWESNFSADGAGTREDLAALGIATYVSPAACKEAAYQPKQLGFDDIEQEITEVAGIFGVDDSGVLSEQRRVLDGITRDDRGLTALWFSSGSDVPYVGAGIGAPQLILDTIGLTNIASGVKDTWTSYNWESVIEANPDVIVLVDADWSTVQKKIGVLEGNPATAALDAVRLHRYLTVPFAASEAGVRTASAAADLAAQLAELDLDAR